MSNAELTRRLDELERTCDRKFKIVFEAIRQLMKPPARKRKPIGFRAKLVTNKNKNKNTSAVQGHKL